MRQRSRQSGFSLLEILVAFSIMALSLGVLLRIFGGAGQTVSAADEYSQAVFLAESIMSSLGIETPLQIGESGGDQDDFHWSLRVSDYPLDTGKFGQLSMPFKAYWVELAVDWGQQGDQRTVNLGTLRLVQENGLNQPFGGDGGVPTFGGAGRPR